MCCACSHDNSPIPQLLFAIVQDTDRDFSWDDLRVVLAIGRGGSLSAAARKLGVNHSTVFRRLGALEERLGARLFERLAEGYHPTAAGEELAATAARIEAEVTGARRRLGGQDTRLSGTLRLTAPDDMAEHLLMAPLARFAARYPEIRLEIVIDNRMLSLTRREADVALRPTLHPPERLVGRRAGRLTSAVYGTEGAGDLAGPEARWIAWDEGAGPPATTRWLAREVPDRRIAYRSSSLLNQMSACRAGLGLALLPCFLGDPVPGLSRVLEPRPEWDSELWLLTHPDLRHQARVRALTDFLFQQLRALGPRLAGENG